MNRNYERPESSDGQDHADTQRRLQQASVALEVAYSRIRQVRTNLLQLSESLPRPDATIPRFNTSSSNVRPDHDILLLSGDLEDESTTPGLRPYSFTGSPRSTSNMNRMIGERVRLSEPEEPSSAGVFVDASLSDSTPRFPSLPLPLPYPNVLPPRFSRREYGNEIQFSNRRGLNVDEASTTRGLRLAGRGTESQGSAINLSEYTAEFDRILERLAMRENVEASSLVLESNARNERQADLLRSALREGRRIGPPSTTGWRAPEARRSRPGSGIRSEAQTHVRNFFEEVDGRVVPHYMLTSSPHTPSATESVDSPFSSRRTQTQPRPSAMPDITLDDGHPPSTDAMSDEEFISWLFPSQFQLSNRDYQPTLPRYVRQANVDSIRVTRTTDTTISPSDTSSRRGWARLDADGNEISVDEEDILERSRTEYRLRALQQRARPNNASYQLSFARSGNSVPDVISQDPNGSRRMYGSVIDSTLNVPHAPQRVAHSSQEDMSPFYVDPLPMPLSSMIPVPRKPDDIYVDIFVPKHTCLAGR